MVVNEDLCSRRSSLNHDRGHSWVNDPCRCVFNSVTLSQRWFFRHRRNLFRGLIQRRTGERR